MPKSKEFRSGSIYRQHETQKSDRSERDKETTAKPRRQNTIKSNPRQMAKAGRGHTGHTTGIMVGGGLVWVWRAPRRVTEVDGEGEDGRRQKEYLIQQEKSSLRDDEIGKEESKNQPSKHGRDTTPTTPRRSDR
ncbi:LOW QUALITY PROTEIN: hypothetical protein CVT26_010021 [Gymnopilus dilepis]|uniref:Uncharacterized protein n=1 Tax=Gymnopilus dilepis TaxID=231916 RepID=A0A409VKZ6_9AGAR|nr:LOW QUALITY PROTEIN: hypothetical protein CVT26_010021 [Gymnopilus dilepis]